MIFRKGERKNLVETMQNFKLQRNASNRKPARRAGPRFSDHPPSYESSTVVNRVFRFKAAAAAANTVTVTNILDLLEVATSTTVAYRLIDAFRIKKIRIWAPPDPTTAVPTTCSIKWYTTSGSYVQTSDTSMGTAKCAYVESKPPIGDAAFWIGSGSSLGTLLSLQTPVGAIVDLHIVYRDILDVAGTASVNSNGTALVVGTTYLNFLDGTAKNLVGQNVLTPV